MATTAAQFAAWIEKGIDLRVEPDVNFDAYIVSDVLMSAGLMALALVGKVGRRRATKMLKAVGEEGSQVTSPSYKAILDELGVSQNAVTELNREHQRRSASEVIQKLREGSFELEPA